MAAEILRVVRDLRSMHSCLAILVTNTLLAEGSVLNDGWQTTIAKLLQHCEDWAKGLDSQLGQPQLYLFGSLINREGSQFNPQESDLDFVVVLPASAADATDRTAWLAAFRMRVQKLELSLIPLLRRENVRKAATSFVAVTRQEIEADIHKSHVRSFFSTTIVRDLMYSGADRALSRNQATPIGDQPRQVLEYVQGLRNRFLNASPSGHIALDDWDGEDPIPKELMRSAAMTYASVNDRNQMEFDVQEGLDYFSNYIYLQREKNERFARLNTWLSVRRGARGQRTPLSNEDHLFLGEVLFDLVTGTMTGSADRGIQHGVSVTEPTDTNAIRAELLGLGYADSPVESATLIGKTAHSTIYKVSFGSSERIVKLTSRNVADIEALSRLTGRSIGFEDRRVAVQVVTPLWVGQSANSLIEVLPFVDGIPAEKVGLMSPSRFRGDILAVIFNGLVMCAHAMHELGVVHRDITPSNLLLSIEDGIVKLLLIDVSFACWMGAEKQVPVATGSYSPPEQKQGMARAVSDFYSIAATIHFLANGSAPSAQPEKLARELKQVQLHDFSPTYLQMDFTEDLDLIEELDLTEAQQCLLALLRPNPDDRPSDYWQLILGHPSRAVWETAVNGLLDFDTYGIVTMTEEGTFGTISAESVPKAATRLLSNATVPEKLRDFLLRKAVPLSKK